MHRAPVSGARVTASVKVVSAGVVLLVGVVVWRLSGASYGADVETLCNAETRSGLTMEQDMPALADWLRGHLATAEGNRLLSRLGDLPMAERPRRLEEAASAAGIRPCPLVDSYRRLVAAGEDRAELQRLCSYVTFPDLAAKDDSARLDTLEAWIEGRPPSSPARQLAEPLRSAVSATERAAVLRAASRAVGIASCDIAKAVAAPVPALDAGPDGEADASGSD